MAAVLLPLLLPGLLLAAPWAPADPEQQQGWTVKQGALDAGNDIGTPIIAFRNDVGDKVALFGPVITRVPSTEQSLRLWDGFMMCATVPGFWELKRTRTERPDFGSRPA